VAVAYGMFLHKSTDYQDVMIANGWDTEQDKYPIAWRKGSIPMKGKVNLIGQLKRTTRTALKDIRRDIKLRPRSFGRRLLTTR